MFNIGSNGIITINRGDSCWFPLQLNIGTNLEPLAYQLSDSTIVYFGVMEPNQPFENALIRKKFTISDCDGDGNIIIKFSPRDTQCVLPGKYYYQVKVQRFNSDDQSDYEVDTVIDKTLFWIME